jgi:hypothetical protein
VRHIAAIVLFASGIAHADDPRDVFGIKHPKTEAPLDCSDGRAFGCVAATDPLSDGEPMALQTWLSRDYLMSLPTADASHDQVAHYAMGAGRDEAGPTFRGANGLENRWTVEGAPTDNLRTGASDTNVPLAFLDGILVTAGGFSARDRTSTGGTIDARLRDGTSDHEIDAHAWASWNAPTRHPDIAPGTYQLRRGYVDPGPEVSAAIVATGPLGKLLGGQAWYAAGIAPVIAATDFTWTAATLVDADNDGTVDGLPGFVTLRTVERDRQTPITWRIPAMARAGFDRDAHHLDLTLLGSAATDASYLFNSTIQAGGIDQTTWIGDAIATWRGTWRDTRARVQFAWHHASRSQSARDPAAAGIPQLLSAYVPAALPEDMGLAGACSDLTPGDPYPKIINCPIPVGYFASGGAGALVDSIADRPTITADVTRRIGGNVLRAGVTDEDSRLITRTRFTGGEQIRSLFPGQLAERQFIDPGLPCPLDPAQACPTVSESELTYRTRYAAAYLEDTWAPAASLSVDGGLRWQLMWVGTNLRFSDELAPRLGASWDPLGGGRSRVWATMGRSFEYLPAGVGHTVTGTVRTVDNVTSPFGTSRIVDTGENIRVVPGVEPPAVDELAFGADVALMQAVRLRGWIQGTWLARGLDTTPEGVDNPGHTGDTTASRRTGMVVFELETAPAAKLRIRTGYACAQTVGSWAGPYNPRQGATFYASGDFVVADPNLAGHLPSELGHRFYIEAERHGVVGPVQLAFATRLTVASGRPRDALGDSDDGIVYLIPRGSAGHDPLLTQANMRLAATWHGFDFTLDVLNLFDRTGATNIDTIYASGPIRPIAGGSYEDLVFLHNDFGVPATRRTTYALGTAFQAPFSAVLGVHHAL